MRPTFAQVDLSAITYNLSQIRKKVTPVRILGVVKANAYGHGITEVSRCLTRNGIDYLGVGFLEEGIFLREQEIHCPILVLGGVLGYQIRQFINYNLEITVSSIELARVIESDCERNGGKARVHLKIDTGMERIGVHSTNALPFIQAVTKMKHIDVVGLYSHLATSDEKDKTFAREQIRRFNSILEGISKEKIQIPLVHLANSGAVLDLPETYYTMVRPGILLYGIYPSEETSSSISLKPVMMLRSRVVFIKEVPPDTSISYGRKFFTRDKTRIATIPIGYGDGYSRLMTNQAHVLIHGKRYHVVGAVCMDQLMVDVGNAENIHVGNDVVLLGKMDAEEITANELAHYMGTVPYEITCGINSRVPREYINPD